MPLTLTWTTGPLLAAALLAGIAFILAGRRGRLVNDHPLCRACRFDLIGLDAATRCPECGADLALRRAITPGLRRRRRWLIASGFLLALAPAALFGMVLFNTARAYDWNRAKPAWWLLRDLRAAAAAPPGAPTADQRLLDELIRRGQNDRLGASVYEALAPMALARQGDLARPWDPRWGHLVELGFERGKIGETQFNRYLDGIIVGLFEVRPKVRAGRPLPARLSIEARAGPLAWLGFTGERTGLRIAGRDQPDLGTRVLRTGGTSREARRGWNGPKYLGERYHPSLDVVDLTQIGRTVSRSDWSPILAPEQPGLYTITTTWRFELQGRDIPTSSRAAAACARRIFERELTRTFTVVPADEPTVAIIEPPAPESAADDPARQTESSLREAFRIHRHNPAHLDGYFTTGPAPCGYAFEVFALVGDREIPLGPLTPIPDDPFDEGDTRQFLLGLPTPLGLEYILRPSPETAELTVDLLSIWGGELRLRESGPLPNLLK